MLLKNSIRKYPNDYDLGEFFFCNYKSLTDINESKAMGIIKDHPNYYELGAYLREKYIEASN